MNFDVAELHNYILSGINVTSELQCNETNSESGGSGGGEPDPYPEPKPEPEPIPDPDVNCDNLPADYTLPTGYCCNNTHCPGSYCKTWQNQDNGFWRCQMV